LRRADSTPSGIKEGTPSSFFSLRESQVSHLMQEGGEHKKTLRDGIDKPCSAQESTDGPLPKVRKAKMQIDTVGSKIKNGDA